jgi:hypothetical protein
MPDMESVAWTLLIVAVGIVAFVFVASKSPTIQQKLQGR